ncbi:putative lipid II flippase FtsW [Halochromatium roseum]|uniref:putative lipid II flippase FtsW n=1 Tax=Halochromatium roseum TaxID=391920 RepID=UPI001913DDAF|nr:putative lipid II flippase FtsW [Halochromatium roseum]MBK5941024.1 putative lipid II flippase FtsW [Halochromatium roseum]
MINARLHNRLLAARPPSASPTPARTRRRDRNEPAIDGLLLVCVLGLLGLGFVMVASASLPIGTRDYADPFFYVVRHGMALGLALICGLICFAIPVQVWERSGIWLLLLSCGLLLLVLVPGIGRTVNGATRWIPLGPFSLQPSELVKFVAVIYISGYLVRRQLEFSNSPLGFIRPMVLIGFAASLIMVQPDFGTTAVILATVMALLLLGGVALWPFALLFSAIGAGLALLIWIEPYRLERVTSFINPFDDPFNTDYQLSHALIAMGRGEWLGVGLGNGIQKQFYLPEAHTDFLLAVIGEELGMVGVIAVIFTFALITWRAFAIGARAQAIGEDFSAYAAHGFGVLLGLQAFISAGVNTGLLPTKGLPLPFISYGSNAVIVSVMVAALLLRIDFELRRKDSRPLPEAGVARHMGTARGIRWRRA